MHGGSLTSRARLPTRKLRPDPMDSSSRDRSHSAGQPTCRSVGGLSPEIQDLVNKLEQIDSDLAAAKTPAAQAPLNAQRADLLEKLADKATTPRTRPLGSRQLADTVSAAVQSGGFPDGITRWNTLCKRLESEKAAPDLVSYVKFRFLSADYRRSQQLPDVDLRESPTEMGGRPRAVRHRLRHDESRGLTRCCRWPLPQEFDGKDDKALVGTRESRPSSPMTPVAVKASGAKRRMESVGTAAGPRKARTRRETPSSVASCAARSS